MKKLLTTKPWSSLLLASVFAPVGLSIFIGGGPSKPQSPVSSELKITNKTKSIEVVGVKSEDPNLIVIVLKNVSSVDMNGFELSVRDHARITGDASVGGWAISPGATHDFVIPERYASSEITILAAMFTDGNIEGDEATVKQLKHWRSGIKQQLLRALPFLETALEAPDVNSPEVLDRLESEFSSFSLDSDDTQSVAARGLRGAKDGLITESSDSDDAQSVAARGLRRPKDGPITESSDSEDAQSLAARGLRGAKDDLITDVRMLRQRLERHGTLNQQKRLLELKKRLEKRIASL
ncbi:MAG: hypothetical protein AABN95_23600 [Acidobacteriota bacterium]